MRGCEDDSAGLHARMPRGDGEPVRALIAIEVGAVDNDRIAKPDMSLDRRLARLPIAQHVLADANVAELPLERARQRALARADDSAEDDNTLRSGQWGRRRRCAGDGRRWAEGWRRRWTRDGCDVGRRCEAGRESRGDWRARRLGRERQHDLVVAVVERDCGGRGRAIGGSARRRRRRRRHDAAARERTREFASWTARVHDVTASVLDTPRLHRRLPKTA